MPSERRESCRNQEVVAPSVSSHDKCSSAATVTARTHSASCFDRMPSSNFVDVKRPMVLN